ncbi:MAG TPA: HepT-like ribonuclease domain-containing protein [Burkholderiaceae bacterium]|nr:HepT-like ribonuclease domain-containing protein [Burkholderiaceae bacterium]
MSPDDLIRLRHMLEAAESALTFVHGRKRSDLDSDAMLRYALTYAVQIFGEAASKVSPAARAEVPTIDWPAIVGMRNRLVHAYADVDRGILWTTIVSDLPALLEQLRAINGINDIPGEED